MSDTDQTIAALRDEIRFLRDTHDIQQLPILYCHYVRRLDIEAILAQFTADATFEFVGMGRTGTYQGESLVAMVSNGLPELTPWPLTHNHHIELIDRSRATGTLHTEFRMGNEAYRATHIGLYEDEYAKSAAGWKFKRRKLTSTPLP
jgi:hypothetical protein